MSTEYKGIKTNANISANSINRRTKKETKVMGQKSDVTEGDTY